MRQRDRITGQYISTSTTGAPQGEGFNSILTSPPPLGNFFQFCTDILLEPF